MFRGSSVSFFPHLKKCKSHDQSLDANMTGGGWYIYSSLYEWLSIIIKQETKVVKKNRNTTRCE